jgi:hypothetical protein
MVVSISAHNRKAASVGAHAEVGATRQAEANPAVASKDLLVDRAAADVDDRLHKSPIDEIILNIGLANGPDWLISPR